MMLKRYALIWCLAGPAAAAFYAGCEEQPEDLTISQFDRPQDVALVCYDDEGDNPLPLSCCKTELTVDDRACAKYAASANLYAFVTQTTSGEVAVVDVKAHKIVDQESSIPYNTFIPVGGQPNDIAASDDGSRVYTANYETGDISVIRVVEKDEDGQTTSSVITDPFLSPAGSINLSPADTENLSGIVARMVLVKSPDEYKDKFALVTQPGLGRLTVVSLFPENCPEPDASPDGCALGYVTLKLDEPEEPEETEEPDDGQPAAPIHPWAITASDGQSAFVGAYDAEVLWDVQIESLVKEALDLSEFGDVEYDKVVNERIPIPGYKTRSISLEPVRRRWIYAVEAESGGVIAVNLQDRTPGSGDAVKPEKVSIPGKTRSLALVELEEEGDPDPFTFNGTFAVAATSQAAFGVIDVEDNQPTTTYFRPHTLRSVVDLSDPDGGVPEMEADPTLTVDDDKVDKRSVKDYLAFNDTDEVDGGCDAGAEFRPEYDNGVRFRCNPYESKRETWSFEWEGSIGVSGVGIIVNIENPEDSKTGPWQLLNEDEFKDFCAQELYTEGSYPNYLGDRLVITSKPTPDEGEEDYCKEKYPSDKTLSYRIVRVAQYDPTDTESVVPNVIEFVAEDKMPPPVTKCFGQAVSFEIRADKQWIVKGSRSSYKRTAGKFKKELGICDYTDEQDTDEQDTDEQTLPPPSKMRMNVGDPFENDYLKFRLSYRDKWENGPRPLDWEEGDTDVEVDAKMEFKIVNGYEEMYRNIVGTNITDIEFTPDNDIVMVDQGGEGLILFDMLTSFNIVGGNVN